MCHNIYGATKEPIDLKTLEGKPIKVHLLDDSESCFNSLQEKFSYPNIYYIGSETGCSCALHADNYYEYAPGQEPEYIPDPEKIPGMDSFCNLLIAEACKHTLEVYSCWDGDEAEPVGERLRFDARLLTTENVFLPTRERRFFTVEMSTPEESPDKPVHFINVDLDIESAEHPQILLDYFQDKWLVLVDPDIAESHFIRYEIQNQCDDAEATILQFCETLKDLPKEVAAFWRECPVRVLDIGYQSGKDKPVLVNSLSLNTLNLIAQYFTGLAITIYPI